MNHDTSNSNHDTSNSTEETSDHNVSDQSHIRIEVETAYVEEQSKPQEKRFVYAYTITINNQTAEDVQLISRHWLIHDANNKEQEVAGLGVVGEQPVIAPQDSYTYTSGCVLETEFGTMQGSYQMRKNDGELFDAPIPTFALATPNAIH